jgi:hypothetical protein
MNDQVNEKRKDKDIVKALWEMRHLIVNDCIANIKKHKDLQFLLTVGGVWFFVRLTIFMLVAFQLFSFLGRIFRMVLG